MMGKKKVLVGMSGGIDSSAVCLMLQDQGYDVVGVTMRVWDLPRHFKADGQEQPDFIQEARALAERLGIPHYVADEREAFRHTVVRNFTDEYLAGRTPNPCVMCNPLFKFRMLMEWADRLGCDFIATGHYVRVCHRNGCVSVCCGIDRHKDQSYFLWRLSGEVLSRCLFPLGGMLKTDVRAYLDEKGFALKAREGESMEVCFIEGDYRDFLRGQVPDIDSRIRPGRFVDTSGRVLGEHRGYAYYTVGQRRGLGVALGYPAFVLRINAEKNTVMLGGAGQLEAHAFLLERDQWTDESAFADPELSVRIRYRSVSVPCRVRRVENRFPVSGGPNELLLVTVDEAVSAVTPGQSAVFYVGDRLVGGAYIAEQRGVGAYI
ncbi:MAG: tRNA 2-thiouridine(34) synthase MnmA [Clostridium sp.]|nr:tRNA 2-thiouridine(34) synthase MnmA [Clostridium sp.]